MASEPKPARMRLVLLAVALCAAVFAGCIGTVDKYYAFEPGQEYKNPGVFVGNYTFGNGGSNVLTPGTLRAGDPSLVQLRSTLPAYPTAGGQETSDGTVLITMGIWRPANTTEPVPIIVDAGPYFEQDCKDPRFNPCPDALKATILDAQQTTAWTVRNFLPHGYAVVQLAVRGTGTSGGCMDLMGPSEVHDLDQAISWLGEQPWSNGNVAMIGASYDGSTPWEVASTGNPHLKAIVPVSGLPDIYDLMFHNGSAETRGAGMYAGIPFLENPSANYWYFGFSDGWPWSDLPAEVPPQVHTLPEDPTTIAFGGANGRQPYQDEQNLLCPEAYKGITTGFLSSETGDRLGGVSDFWTTRDHRPAVLNNYTGSVFLVHGLQDWNVDPHSAIPFNTQLRAKGLPMKEWYGQWDHAFPDSRCAPGAPSWAVLPCRLDFAETLLRWFDTYLKGAQGLDLGPSVQVQDDVGDWHNLDAFPPAAQWSDLHLGSDMTLGKDGGPEQSVQLTPDTPQQSGNFLEFKGAVLDHDLYFTGLPTMKVPFSVEAQGGELGAWLFDEDAGGKVRTPYTGFVMQLHKWVAYGNPIIGHAQLNLRYYAGGEAMQPLVPGQRYVAQVQFEPLDVLLPKGHRLVLWLFQGQYDDHQSTGTPSPINVFIGGDQAMLNLPVQTPDPKTFFPVPGIHMWNRTVENDTFVDKPLAPPMPLMPAGLGQEVAEPSCASDAARSASLVDLPDATCPSSD